MIGVINLYKPPGMSSNQALGRLRRITGQRYSGHAGTLDPEAAGVLPILMGKASRLFDYLQDSKEYIAEITFGVATDTLDCEGEVIARDDVTPTKEAVIEALEDFKGEINQIPPMYSAIKQNGVPLYKLARQGKDVEVPSRTVYISDIEYLEQTGERSHLIRVACSKGTYIRTLCADIGRALGTNAVMSFLLRTASSNIRIENAFNLEDIEEMAQNGDHSFLMPVESLVAHLPRIDLDESYMKKAVNGNQIDFCSEDMSVACLYCNGMFIGMVKVENNTIIAKALLVSAEDVKL